MKKFLVGLLLAIAGFTSVYAVIQPDIRGWSTIVNPNPDNYFTVIQSGTSQGKISMANFINAVSGSLDYVPRSSWNGGKNIEFADDGAIEVVNIGRDNPFDNSLTLTYVGDGSDTVNNQTQIRIGGQAEPYMNFMFTSGGSNNVIEFFRNKVFSNIIFEYYSDFSANYTDRSLVDKGYADTKVPRTAVDTGWNNKTSDTIIPSEKTVWSLVTGLTNNYMPYWSGEKLYDSIIQQDSATSVYISGSFSASYAGALGIMAFDNRLGTQVGMGGASNEVGVHGQTTTGIAIRAFVTGTGNSTIGVRSINSNGFGFYSETLYGNGMFINKNINTTSTGYALAINNFSGGSGPFLSGREHIHITNFDWSGNVETIGSYILTGGTTSWRMIVSGDNLSFQAFTGGVWVEKGSFTP